jgi:RNA polymerase sigma-70 factor (ECF subfamily)
MDLMEIHDQYYQRIRKYILALVRNESAADDLIQETFIKIQENLDGLRDPERLSSWIFRIAYHLCQDHFRTLKKASTHQEIPEDLANFQEIPISLKLEQKEMSQCVQDQLDLLPDSQRQIIILAEVMEFSLQEIADILGISVQNVKVRLHRVRKKFKAILEEKCTFAFDERNVRVCEPIQSQIRSKSGR